MHVLHISSSVPGRHTQALRAHRIPYRVIGVRVRGAGDLYAVVVPMQAAGSAIAAARSAGLHAYPARQLISADTPTLAPYPVSPAYGTNRMWDTYESAVYPYLDPRYGPDAGPGLAAGMAGILETLQKFPPALLMLGMQGLKLIWGLIRSRK